MTCRCWWSCSIGKNGREPRTDGPIWYWPGSASFAETIQVLARRKSSRRSSYRLRLFFLSFYPRRLIIDPRWPNPWRLCNCKNSAKIAPPFFVKKQEEEMREGGDNKKRWPQTEQREREREKRVYSRTRVCVTRRPVWRHLLTVGYQFHWFYNSPRHASK